MGTVKLRWATENLDWLSVQRAKFLRKNKWTLRSLGKDHYKIVEALLKVRASRREQAKATQLDLLIDGRMLIDLKRYGLVDFVRERILVDSNRGARYRKKPVWFATSLASVVFEWWNKQSDNKLPFDVCRLC